LHDLVEQIDEMERIRHRGPDLRKPEEVLLDLKLRGGVNGVHEKGERRRRCTMIVKVLLDSPSMSAFIRVIALRTSSNWDTISELKSRSSSLSFCRCAFQAITTCMCGGPKTWNQNQDERT
jgi:hypothetical protein